MVSVNRTQAVALFKELGVSVAAKWPIKRMAAKIAKIDAMVMDDTEIEDEDLDNLLTEILEAIEDDVEIKVVDDKAAEKTTTAKKKTTKKKTAKKKPAAGKQNNKGKVTPEPEEDEDEMVPIHKPTKKKKAKKKTAKKKTEDAAATTEAEPVTSKTTKPRLVGVRETATRASLAGEILKKHGGLEHGVTDAMVDELDEAYGRTNRAESFFKLRTAWHAVRGFTGWTSADIED